MKNQLHELAHSIYAPMFAEKDTLKDAFLYAHELARASNDSTAVFTALFVVCNTIAKEIEGIADQNNDKGKEDRHIQFHLENKDYDLILRADDEGKEYKSFDIFDYQAQEYKAKGTI